MAVTHVTTEDFLQEVIRCDKKVLVDFWAPWCTPCRMLAPTLEQLAADRQDVKFVKVDVDKDYELAKAYRVISIPALVVLEQGKVLSHTVGARPRAQIEALL